MYKTESQFTGRTLQIWQARTSKVLTLEDARQIAENVTGFFQILMEWEAANRHTANQVTRTKTETECHLAEGCPE